MKTKILFRPLIFFIILIIGCSSSKEALYINSSFTQPFQIAVLPFENQTTELAVSELSRLFFVLGMEEKGYQIQPISQTDSILLEMGITDGGQLTSVTVDELLKKLNVTGLLYGNVLEAEYSTLAIIQKQNVKVHIRLYRNSDLVWEDEEEEGSTGIGNIINPLQGLAQQVVDKQFKKIFSKYYGHPLEGLTEIVAYKLQDKMPGIRKEKSGWN